MRVAGRAAAVLAVACALLVGCARGGSASGEIRVGVISMLTGDEVRPGGRNLGRAVRLAAKEANARGGLRVGNARRPVTVVEMDDGNSPDTAVEVARTLILKERVVALIGPQFSSNAIPVARLAEQERVPMICPASTHPDTTAGRSFVFRIPFVDTFQGAVLARFARERLRVSRAAILVDETTEYSTTLARIFAQTFSSLGGSVVASEAYAPEAARDFGAYLRRVKAAQPDLLFLPNYADDVLAQAKQARSLGITAILLGGDGWDGPAFASEPALADSFYTTLWHPASDAPRSEAFVAAFAAAYGETASDLAATAFDAANLLFAAIEHAGRTDAEAIRDALGSMPPFEGVTGSVSYRGSGDPVRSALIVRIQPGLTSVYAVIEPQTP